MGQSQISLNKVGRKGNRTRGFRVSPRRFSVYRLRVRFLYFIRVLSRWKSSYVQTLKKGMSRCSGCKRNSKASMEEGSFNGSDCKLRNYGRSNSFYSEAIADCLEFIKRSSVSVDDNPAVQR